ncbi:hypothetical protein BGX34_006925 [Mortierella sp. NVP85]|nr:hypothetical protein BGX34_006925 [Mortierella sp. NVP85]
MSVDPNTVRNWPSPASASSSTSGQFFNDRNVTISGGVAQSPYQAQGHGRHSSQAIILSATRLFAQQLQDPTRRAGIVRTGPRSIASTSMSGRGTAASTAASIVRGSSPALGNGGVRGDEPFEHTLLLVRPTWVLDQDAAACQICVKSFNTMRRKHHCRQCGRVLCHECSSRSIALPQLGYTKAVRVCNDCFEVAYLVAYCVSDDLGQSTQIHGARGLYDLIKTNSEKVIEGVLTHGGLDAIVYLCGVTRGHELHALATASLAALAERREVQGVVVAKRTMPKLFRLVHFYTHNAIMSTRPLSPSMNTHRSATNDNKDVQAIEAVSDVLMNITHTVFQMVPDKLLARQLAKEGAMDSLINICVYFPAGVRTRAMEHALRDISLKRTQPEGQGEGILGGFSQQDLARRSLDSYSQYSFHGGDDYSHSGVDEGTLLSISDQVHDQLENMQGLAAKCISIMTTDVSNQSFIVEDPERIDRLVQLLYSTNMTVAKYASKTMAFLSLRNDRYKPDIVRGSGAAALLAVIQGAYTSEQALESSVVAEAVSHAACALANLATNTESQEILMSHAHLLSVTCAAVGLFPHQREIERHVARLVANLALYEQNKVALLTPNESTWDNTLVDPAHQQHEHPFAHHRTSMSHRYSSPPPARRAKGNVIPTLIHIGELTLERVHRAWDPETEGDHGSDTVSGEDMSGGEGSFDQKRSATPESEEEFSLGWSTIPGMEDVQRHIVRAIDNLLTSVQENPSSGQSFTLFSRVWPTIGLVKTIQLTNQDEDTQRRALHVLSTLIQLQEIHADALAALQQQQQAAALLARENHTLQSAVDSKEERISSEEQEPSNQVEQVSLKEMEEEKEKERLEQEKIEIEKKEKAKKDKAERRRIEKERQEKEREENERLEKERLEAERLEAERLENERLEKERLEQERIELERLEKKRIEEERREKKRLEKERQEKERQEKERQEKERQEKERLEKERLEKEMERLEKERLERERLEEEERLEKERLERLERERVEEEERLEKERLERLEQESINKARMEKREEAVMANADSVPNSPPSKGVSSSEEQTSQDDEPAPVKDKTKKKKKKKAK